MINISKWDLRGSVSFLLFLSLMTIAPGPAGSRSSKAELACLLRSGTKSFCSISEDTQVPDRLQQLYNNMSVTLRRSCRRGKLSVLSPDEFTQIPVPLLLLIPAKQLKEVSGSALAWNLREHLTDTVIAFKMTEALDFAKHHRDFFKRLEGVNLPQRTQDILAQSLLKWQPDAATWNHELFGIIEKVGDPLLAHIPPYFLPSVSETVAVKFLFYLRNWHWDRPVNTWEGKSEAQKRVWTNTVVRYSYPFNLSQWTPGDAHSFLLEGATPDELKILNGHQMPPNLLHRNLNKLQFRTVFNILHKSSDLGSRELIRIMPEASKLLPSNLQKFQINTTDFTVFTVQEGCSLATAKQIAESLIAQALLSKKLESAQPEEWGSGIEHIGKFVYALDTDILERYKPAPPLPFLLSKIDSIKITKRQARLLVGKNAYIVDKPEILMNQHGMLRAISSFQITIGNMKHFFLEHLLRNLPSGSMMQSAALLHKVFTHLDVSTLRNMLSNPEASQFFELLTSHQVALIYPLLEKVLEFPDSDQMQTAIKSLPRNTLSVILRISKDKMGNSTQQWTMDTILSGKSKLGLLGISCSDINAINLVDFIYIMGHYNMERQKLGREFPKNLQYCSQLPLMQYLKMKANMLKDKSKRHNLDYLEPPEIEAIGEYIPAFWKPSVAEVLRDGHVVDAWLKFSPGYILASLPLENIEGATYGYHILEAIGRLPLTELLVATKETKPHSLAKFMLNYFAKRRHNIEIVQLFSLGNLIHFLQPDEILKISPSAFKLFMESIGDSRSKMVCGNSEVRLAFYDVIMRAFGKPFTWTAGVLATLGDFLLVVPTDELSTIPASSYIDAADVLVDQTSYHLHVEWPGETHTIPFFHACSKLLSESESLEYIKMVHWLGRWRLMAVQSQMDTVVNAQNLLGASQNTDARVIVPDLEVPSGIAVKVLEPKMEEKSTTSSSETREQNLNTASTSILANTFEHTSSSISSTGTTPDYSTIDKGTIKQLLEEQSTIKEIEHGVNTLSSQSTNAEHGVTKESSESADTDMLAHLSESIAVLETKVQNKLDVENEADLTSRDKRKIEEIMHEHRELKWTSIRQEESGDLLRQIILASQNISGTNHTLAPVLTTTEYGDAYIPGPWPRISCGAVRAAGLSAAVGLDENDIRGMDPKELDKCIDTFGMLELDSKVQKAIWRQMNKEKFTEELSIIGNLVQAIDEELIWNLNLNLNTLHGLDNLAILGQHVKDPYLLEAIGNKFTRSNPTLATITTEIAIALGRILCEILPSSGHRLLFEHSVFFNASPVLGRIQDCPSFCLKKLTHLATKDFAFGSPETWTADDMATLGTIVAGLKSEQWRQLNSDAFVGLSPSAVKCIPPTMFKELNEEQLKSLPLLSTAVISEVQLSYLSMQQRAALERILPPEHSKLTRASGASLTKDILLVILSVISIVYFV